MDVTLVQISALNLLMVPVVIALTALARMYVDSKWAPLISLALGILGAFVAPMATVPATILQGVLIGLSASGLYSGTKAVFS